MLAQGNFKKQQDASFAQTVQSMNSLGTRQANPESPNMRTRGGKNLGGHNFISIGGITNMKIHP